jgi:hypothetical protein
MAVDPVALRRLYAQEELSTTEVATHLGCSATTVRRRLRALDIAVRPRGPGPFSRSQARSRRIGPRPRAWSPEIAYAIGLLATDGNLSPDGRHLAVSSKDRDLLEILRRCLGLRVAITPSRSGAGRWYWHLQWGDRDLYDWLVDLGLTPAKSRTIGALAVPDACFADFLRGCIDGDGSIVIYVDRFHATKDERYVYTRLVVSLVSASPRFSDLDPGDDPATPGCRRQPEREERRDPPTHLVPEVRQA